MDDSSTFLGLDSETITTIITTALTIVSIFIVVTVGYFLYHYLFEKKEKK